MADDDRGVRERLAALEAEVKAEADVARARKDEALARLREQQAEQAELRARQQALVAKKPTKRDVRDDDDDEDARDGGLSGAIELANKANRVRNELAKKPGKGGKSWMISGVASLALGPLGWLYAGSLRESVPAATIWVLLAALAGKILPTLLLWPVLMVVMPLSGIAGVVYALQYNRHGGRQRLFDSDEKNPRKQLKSGREG
ncbi:MAG TPA: hypothetical protein VH143_29335 [Kofleriaceae bacterium]|nr:hypothetical protein [Kofleriaceae bacterium]